MDSTRGRRGTNASDDSARLFRQFELLAPLLKGLIAQHERVPLSIQVNTVFSVHTRTEVKTYHLRTFGQSMPLGALSDKLCLFYVAKITEQKCKNEIKIDR